MKSDNFKSKSFLMFAGLTVFLVLSGLLFSIIAVSAATPVSTYAITLDFGIGSTDILTDGQVTLWQNLLIADSRGQSAAKLKSVFISGVPKGYFGSLTGAATEEWQRANGIVSAYPRVGPKTRALVRAREGDAPVISLVTPTSIAVNQTVVITGSGFTSTKNVVHMDFFQADGVIASAVSSDGKSLSFVMPQYGGPDCDGLACLTVAYGINGGAHKIYVANGNGTSNGVDISIIAPVSQMPVISSIAPAAGPIGASVVISGSGFDATDNKVNFLSVSIGYAGIVPGLPSPDGKTIALKVPSGVNPGCYYGTPKCLAPGFFLAPGAYQISVIAPSGTSNSMLFTVTAQ